MLAGVVVGIPCPIKGTITSKQLLDGPHIIRKQIYCPKKCIWTRTIMILTVNCFSLKIYSDYIDKYFFLNKENENKKLYSILID